MNKAQERFLLDGFFGGIKLFRSATIVESERPDFIVESKRKRIGIEITEYHQGATNKGSRAKESEMVWNQILTQVSTGSNRDHFTGLIFTSSDFPKKAERGELVNELLALAKDAKPPNSTEQVVVTADNLGHLSLARYVRKIYLIGTRSARGVKWERANSIAGSVGFSEAELAQILKSKRERVRGYDRTRFEEIWLLIVAKGTSAASTGDILKSPVEALAAANQPALSEAGFDQIWYFSYLPEFRVRMFPKNTYQIS